MIPFMQSGMQPPSPCEHEVMIHCVQALSEINNHLMAITGTLNENAASIRKTLEAMTDEPKQSAPEPGIVGKMSFPNAPGMHVIEIDPSNPQATFDMIQNIIKKKLDGGNGYGE